MIDPVKVLLEMARQEGYDLSDQEALQLRTRVAACLSAKERHRQRMNAGAFEWKKPQSPRR